MPSPMDIVWSKNARSRFDLSASKPHLLKCVRCGRRSWSYRHRSLELVACAFHSLHNFPAIVWLFGFVFIFSTSFFFSCASVRVMVLRIALLNLIALLVEKLCTPDAVCGAAAVPADYTTSADDVSCQQSANVFSARTHSNTHIHMHTRERRASEREMNTRKSCSRQISIISSHFTLCAMFARRAPCDSQSRDYIKRNK